MEINLLVESLLVFSKDLEPMEQSQFKMVKLLKPKSNMLKVLDGTEDTFLHISLPKPKLLKLNSKIHWFFFQIKKSQTSNQFLNSWNMQAKTKDNLFSLLKILMERHLLHLFLINSEVAFKLLLSSHQDSEITEETQCKILPSLPEPLSSVKILV